MKGKRPLKKERGKRLDKKVSLARALSKLGIVSRRQAGVLIESGHVSVNGRYLRNPEVRVDPEKEIIRLDDQVVEAAPPLYLMMHKPKGVVTTRSDEKGRKTIYDLFTAESWVFPVGRLDRESSGLLLLTNDTQWGNRMVAPESKVPKIYHVKLNRRIEERDLKKLEEGIRLEEGKTLPAKVLLLRETEKGCWIEFTLQEGKNRQIRRMSEALGYRVGNLVRVQIGNLKLGDLPSGGIRPLTRIEVEAIFPFPAHF
jgi:23S rRNA pseudouridine2605 synthase